MHGLSENDASFHHKLSNSIKSSSAKRYKIEFDFFFIRCCSLFFYFTMEMKQIWFFVIMGKEYLFCSFGRCNIIYQQAAQFLVLINDLTAFLRCALCYPLFSCCCCCCFWFCIQFRHNRPYARTLVHSPDLNFNRIFYDTRFFFWSRGMFYSVYSHCSMVCLV